MGSGGGGFVIDTATLFMLVLGIAVLGIGLWRLFRKRR
jgi:LPXTG-motif cell wall-anchored protein